MQPLSRDLDLNIKKLYSTFPISKSFDFLTRNLFLGETKAFWIGINGMCKMDVLQQIFSDLQNPQYMTDNKVENILNYMNARLGYAQASLCDNWEALTHKLLSGPTVLFIDGFDQAIIIDVRNYPSRNVEEPDTEKVTLGARDGFVESMLSNTNLIRRRIRSPKLTFETMTLGEESQTDIAIGYLESSADPKLLWKLKKTLQNLTVTSLTMGAKSLEELLMPKRWFHPLPCMHYTERPDVACSFLTEGHIVLIVDTSPSVLVLPCTIFQFTQSPEDYYKSPIVGTYFRLVRYLCIPISLLIMPVFLLLTGYFPQLSEKWNLLSTGSLPTPTIIFYVFASEGTINRKSAARFSDIGAALSVTEKLNRWLLSCQVLNILNYFLRFFNCCDRKKFIIRYSQEGCSYICSAYYFKRKHIFVFTLCKPVFLF